jgi:hypothetical protein
MKWDFLGFHNWPACSGSLDLLQGFDVFRASLSQTLPREVCESCACWRLSSTCRLVQVDDWESDAADRSGDNYKDFPKSECLSKQNCCPVLFFDFIGRTLPPLVVNEG